VRTLTPAQLTRAQLGEDVTLNTGETLTASPNREGWKYFVAFDGMVGLIVYAPNGIDAAIDAINLIGE